MTIYTEEIGNHLNTLLEKNYDAEKGYKTAAENVDSIILTNFFDRKATQRKRFAEQLKAELKDLAQEPETDGSVTGTLHRTWMNTKAMFSINSDEAMLEETIRGEKASLEDYNEVLDSKLPLPESIKKILTNQKNTINYDTLTIKKLEDIH
ncbi:uncharacterized protein (TIGR02284 family) [Kordia periserrulae]|uniref:Uncharacterized protein (TIGR02284 family) n=1 Tax=Kordia periserrulae TaxID=701523 RepID=A0A2T6BRT8_9FLAO|nr:PA2169 family four-helix-bundle protein [Kordia periserrulae]PTX58805.1 uncharacterized protein (TIGR02284 family) [Kordia periserrulae]